MRKSIVALGLAGLIGIGYWASRHSTAESYVQVQMVESAENPDKTVARSPFKKAYTNPTSSSIEEEVDFYREYVNNLYLIPRFFYEAPVIPDLEHECQEEEIKGKHEKVSQIILYNNNEHALWDNMDYLIQLDARLANCKYKDNPEKFRELMLEIAEHLESTNRPAGAGRVYYALREIDKAREFFLRDEDSVEETIKITPKEDLPALVQHYLQHNNLLAAGKVEWFESNMERAEVLIKASKEYKQFIEQSKKYIQRGQYKTVVNALWHLLVPFYKKTMLELCDNNVQCQEVVNNYDPWRKSLAETD